VTRVDVSLGQFKQADDDVAPALLEYLPISHLAHDDWAVSTAKEPASHVRQGYVPVEFL
jgi:hypothetical protein